MSENKPESAGASVPPLDPLDLSQEAARWDDQGGVYIAMKEHPQRVWFNGYGEALQWCAKRVRAALRAAAMSPTPLEQCEFCDHDDLLLRVCNACWKKAHEGPQSQVTRFEVIDETGRILVRRPCKIELSYQDAGRTLKVFVDPASAERAGIAPPTSHQPSDETILKAISTFENGCDFTLRFTADGRVFIRFGCYGVHVNLAQGARRALMEWLDPENGGERELIGLRPETVLELKSRKPCSRCGGFTFESAERAASPTWAPDWHPIERCPDRERELWFWIRAKTADEAYCDTSGRPITADGVQPLLHIGKHGTWNSLMTATHWMEPRWPAPPQADK